MQPHFAYPIPFTILLITQIFFIILSLKLGENQLCMPSKYSKNFRLIAHVEFCESWSIPAVENTYLKISAFFNCELSEKFYFDDL